MPLFDGPHTNRGHHLYMVLSEVMRAVDLVTDTLFIFGIAVRFSVSLSYVLSLERPVKAWTSKLH